MKTHWDAIVIGTGPAGLAFAATAAKLGLDVLAMDEQASPGGQIYRNIEHQTTEGMEVLGADYRNGKALVEAFFNSNAQYVPQATAWKIEADGRVCYSCNGESREISAHRVVIAIGAMERPVPFAGWTLPGVMGVGAVDTLYKSAGVLPKGPVTLVGNGPLMLSVAGHLNKLGIKIENYLETKPQFSTLSALPRLPRALAKPGYLFKGASMLMKMEDICKNVLKKKDVIHYAAKGNGHVETLSYQCNSPWGKEKGEINTHSVLVHEGIIPRFEFAGQLHLAHRWNPVQRYWYPELDSFGRTSEENIYIAGDSGFVHGAVAAEKKGQLAAFSIAADLDRLPRGVKKFHGMVHPIMKSLKRELSPRPFVDMVYRPRPNLYAMDGETLVCRCEEVTARQIRTAISQGMKTPEMVKSITRCGMGPCQGRMCSTALAELIAEETGEKMTALSPLSIRPPVRNLPVGQLVRMTFLETSKTETTTRKKVKGV